MNQLLFPLLSLISQWMTPQYDARMRLLHFQNKMLRDRIDATRIVPTLEERAELLRLGALCDHDIDDLITVVVPETYKTWLRKARQGVRYKRSGRSRIAEAIRRLVHRIAGENKHWSYRRVCGELKKLGIFIGDTTVRKIMIEDGLGPSLVARYEKPPITWTNFIKTHMDTLVACDFFTKKIHTWHGNYTVHVLVFIHLGTRKVYHSYPTMHPNRDWVIQECRNASMWLEGEGLEVKFLLRDRDAKYPNSMKAFWEDQDVTTVKTPVRSPKANAFCESFIGTLKRECLNHFMCFSIDHLHYITRTWIRYYNTERPHRGKDIGNRVLDVDFTPRAEGNVKCKEQLGGIIRSYYREAA